jgi:hypothetical protein
LSAATTPFRFSLCLLLLRVEAGDFALAVRDALLRERDAARFGFGRDRDCLAAVRLRWELEDVEFEAAICAIPFWLGTCLPALGLPNLQGN